MNLSALVARYEHQLCSWGWGGQPTDDCRGMAKNAPVSRRNRLLTSLSKRASANSLETCCSVAILFGSNIKGVIGGYVEVSRREVDLKPGTPSAGLGCYIHDKRERSRAFRQANCMGCESCGVRSLGTESERACGSVRSPLSVLDRMQDDRITAKSAVETFKRRGTT